MPDEPPASAPAKPTAQILIVDDEPPQMKALCDTLLDNGFSTTGFTSGKTALAEMRKRSFDLVLTDLMMPEMDGIDLLRRAKEIDPNLVGIIMTGEGTISTAVEAMKVGAFDYILKPFQLNAIMPTLTRALAMRRLRIHDEELEAGMRRRTGELEAANKELEAFNYSVSHDLRAPLRHINGYLEALREDTETQFSENGKRYVDAIGKSAGLMTKLIEDLLSVSRLGRAEMHQAQFSMGELVQEVIAEMASDIKDRKIEWDIQPLPTVHGDRAMLKQVWVNLLSNAVKYSRPRNPARIAVCAEKKGGEWTFRVSDNGVGFDMRNINKLFGVFQRLHDASEFEGTGVGLANVHRMILRHGGRTWAESKLDEGTSLFFTLPT